MEVRTGLYLGLRKYWNFQNKAKMNKSSPLLQRVAFLVFFSLHMIFTEPLNFESDAFSSDSMVEIIFSP